MSFDNFSRGDTMMRRRIEHTGMKVGVRIGPDGKKMAKTPTKIWEDCRSHVKLVFPNDIRKRPGSSSLDATQTSASSSQETRNSIFFYRPWSLSSIGTLKNLSNRHLNIGEGDGVIPSSSISSQGEF